MKTRISLKGMRRRMFRLAGVVLVSLLPFVAGAQIVAVKTNALYDATGTVNLGVEFSVAPRWSLDISGDLNAWEFSHDRMWKHWFLQPEARWWSCDCFSGGFFAFHLHGGQFNIGNLDNDIDFLGSDFSELSDQRVQGWFLGAGVGYGYSWVLSRHWNIEAEIGLGYAFTRYDMFECVECGKKIKDDKTHHYVGPSKAAINLLYLF